MKAEKLAFTKVAFGIVTPEKVAIDAASVVETREILEVTAKAPLEFASVGMAAGVRVADLDSDSKVKASAPGGATAPNVGVFVRASSPAPQMGAEAVDSIGGDSDMRTVRMELHAPSARETPKFAANTAGCTVGEAIIRTAVAAAMELPAQRAEEVSGMAVTTATELAGVVKRKVLPVSNTVRMRVKGKNQAKFVPAILTGEKGGEDPGTEKARLEQRAILKFKTVASTVRREQEKLIPVVALTNEKVLFPTSVVQAETADASAAKTMGPLGAAARERAGATDFAGVAGPSSAPAVSGTAPGVAGRDQVVAKTPRTTRKARAKKIDGSVESPLSMLAGAGG
ncbi:uncharacterized protein LOC120324435 [Pipra filicauda]|uniref:Uncharacterized protein LOC120324435 n=1 Tax=Pipra filicauda TaxID=649802 RepID=A0A7R5L116_9PASS|nr:uncharacterized protein LOC120324435 [Pipra filicauda]XP_039243032.1 uncharacterized protein LOC120324435 [Pipra filicauda]XP_039243033.1 uncharacterized protein LOC120324435 [Pipra filicauda]